MLKRRVDMIGGGDSPRHGIALQLIVKGLLFFVEVLDHLLLLFFRLFAYILFLPFLSGLETELTGLRVLRVQERVRSGAVHFYNIIISRIS